MPSIAEEARSFPLCVGLPTLPAYLPHQRFKSQYSKVRIQVTQLRVVHDLETITVEIRCSEDAIGGVYSSLNKRRGQVFSAEQHPAPMFTVKAFLPVAESFGFNAELSKHTGGKATPQCMFDHWESMNGCKCAVVYACI